MLEAVSDRKRWKAASELAMYHLAIDEPDVALKWATQALKAANWNACHFAEGLLLMARVLEAGKQEA